MGELRKTEDSMNVATDSLPEPAEQLSLFDAGAETEDERKPGATWNGHIWVSDADLPEGM